jgi:hypothetical protein
MKRSINIPSEEGISLGFIKRKSDYLKSIKIFDFVVKDISLRFFCRDSKMSIWKNMGNVTLKTQL